MSLAVKLTNEVLDMADRIEALEIENARLRKVEADFNKLLKEDIAHNDKMMVNWLALILDGRIKLASHPKEGLPIG